MSFIKNIWGKWNSNKNTDDIALSNALGISLGNKAIYTRALIHRSVNDKIAENNERLEYLGDAIFGSVVADYLFKHYPFKDEGFLTEMRSKMVNRNQMNEIAIKMGLNNLTQFNKADHHLRRSQIFGNTLEAVIGAVYLDKGYDITQKWIIKKIITPFLFVDELENSEYNQKNKLLGWAAKNNKQVAFQILNEEFHGGRRQFSMSVTIDDVEMGKGLGFSKKEASEAAAIMAIENLNI